MDLADRLRLRLPDAAATARLAVSLAPHVEAGFILYLSGDLGAGKTAFARSLLRALGATGRVKSPSFSLLESYDLSRFRLYHFDFYRFDSDEDWLDAGFEEYFGAPNVALVEWPERAARSLPTPDLHLRLGFVPEATPAGPDIEEQQRDEKRRDEKRVDENQVDERRIVDIEAPTARGRAWLKALRADDANC